MKITLSSNVLGLTLLTILQIFLCFNKGIFIKNNRPDLSIPIESRKSEACRHLSKSFPIFLSTLRSNADDIGLRDWMYDDYRFPGLDDRLLAKAFRGRRIGLVGDSTLYYPMKWLYVLMNRTSVSVLSELPSKTLSEGRSMVNPENTKHVGLDYRTRPPPIVHSDGTMIRWFGFSGLSPNTCHFDTIWKKILKMRPEILVVNFGLHWLHLTGIGRNVSRCVMENWVEYESFLEKSVLVAKEAGARILLLKSTNFVCDKQYFGNLATSNILFKSKDPHVLEQCSEIVGKALVNSSLGTSAVHNYCVNGTFNEVGATHLNNRLVDFVRKRRNDSKLQIGIFNDHDIESCHFTTDARHYHALNMVRIRLLGNLLECIL